MTIATYAELVAAVEDWTDRDDLTTRIPLFVKLTEAKANRRLEDPEQEVISEAVAAGDYTALPADFGEMVSVTTGTGQALRPMGAADYAGTDETLTGTERFYVIVDGSIGFYPRNSTAAIRMVYRRTIHPLTADDDTNWLLTRAPDVYLYGVLFEYATWDADPEAASGWKGLFENAMSEMLTDGARRKWGAGALAPRIRRT